MISGLEWNTKIVRLSRHCDIRHTVPSAKYSAKKLTLNLIKSLELTSIYRNIKHRGTSKMTPQGKRQIYNVEYSIQTTKAVTPTSQWQGKWRWWEYTALDSKRPHKYQSNAIVNLIFILMQTCIFKWSGTFIYGLNIR